MTGYSEYVGTFIILCLSSDQGPSRCRAVTKGPHLPSPFDWYCTACRRNSSVLQSVNATPSGRTFVLSFPGSSLAAPSRDSSCWHDPLWFFFWVIVLSYFSRSHFLHGAYYPEVLGNSSCQWLACGWLYLMRWIYILKHKLPGGLHLEVVVGGLGLYLCPGNGSLVGGDGKDLICSLSDVLAHVRPQWEGIACKLDRPWPALEPAGTLFLNFPGSIITRIECLFKIQTKQNQELSLWQCVIGAYNGYDIVKFFSQCEARRRGWWDHRSHSEAGPAFSVSPLKKLCGRMFFLLTRFELELSVFQPKPPSSRIFFLPLHILLNVHQKWQKRLVSFSVSLSF